MTGCVEKTFDDLCLLLENRFGECAARVNELHDDGIRLPEHYKAGSKEEEKLFAPCIMVSYKETEYSEKDRIIELPVFTFEISFDLGKIISFRQRFRLEEALALFAEENRRCGFWQCLKVETFRETGAVVRLEI